MSGYRSGMDVLNLILYLIAALCFLGAALVSRRGGTPPIFWSTLVAVGLLSWVLVPLISQARSM